MDRAERLASESTGRLLFEFSLPCIAGTIVQSLYNIIDRIYVGNGAGTLAITGVTICFPLMAVFMAFGMLAGMGGSSLFSLRMGQGRREEAGLILGNTFVLLVVLSVSLCSAAGMFLEPVLRLFGASSDSLPYAVRYMKVILFGVPFQAVGFGMNNFIRAQGRPFMAMATMMIGAFLNAVIAPVFIFMFHMGITGAALATVLAQSVSCLWVLLFLAGTGNLITLKAGNLRIQGRIVRGILSIGMAPFFMQAGACLVVTVFNHQLVRYGGDVAVSAYGIVHSIAVFTLMPVIGISQGAQPIMGFNYGAGNFYRVRSTLFQAMRIATGIVMLGFCIAMTAPDLLVKVFNPGDPLLRETGSRALRIFLAFLPLAGVQICASGYFQAVGKPARSVFLSLVRQIIVLLPCLFIFPFFFGLSGIWLAGPVSDFSAFLVAAAFTAREMKHLDMSDIRAGNRIPAAEVFAEITR